MQQKIRLAHFSDLHYSAGNLAEADRCFEDAVTKAIGRGVDCAVITGDSTDHAVDAHSPAVRALAAQVRRLSNHCPVLMLQGTFSHEPPGFLKMLAMVEGRHKISVADGISSWGFLPESGFTRFDEGLAKVYQLIVSTLPTLNKAHLAAMQEHICGSDTEMGVRSAVSGVLRSWAGLHEDGRKNGIPSMVLSHGTVFNSVSEHGVPMAGTDHELGLDALYSAGADAVALGHIHMHQSWTNGSQVVAYAGSIGRFHYGEIGEKGWLEWSLGDGGASFEFVPTPSRRNVDLVFEGPPDLEEIKRRASECQGAFVRIQYSVDEEFRHNVSRAAIRAILEGAAEVQIEGRTGFVQRQRAAGISTAVSMHQKLAQWAAATSTPGSDALSERLSMIEADPPEVVAEKVVASMPA